MLGVLGIGFIVYVLWVMFAGVSFYIGTYQSTLTITEEKAVRENKWRIIFNFARIIKDIDKSIKEITEEHIADSDFLYKNIKNEAIEEYCHGDEIGRAHV